MQNKQKRCRLSELANTAFSKLRCLPESDKKSLVESIESFSWKKRFLHLPPRQKEPIPHPIALTPFLVASDSLPLLHRLSSAFYRFHAILPDLYAEDRLNFRDLCPLGERAEAWFFRHYRPDANQHDFLIRLDVGLITGRDGRDWPVVYETNAVALAGLYNHWIGVEILKSFVFPRVFSSEELAEIAEPPDLLDFFIAWLMNQRVRAGDPDEKPAVGLVERRDTAGYSEIPQIVRYCRQRGLEVAYGDPAEIEQKGHQVSLGGTSLDLIYRDISYTDMEYNEERYRGLMEGIKEDRVIPTFASEFGHKGVLECLTTRDYEGFFSGEDKQLFASCVPWTRVIWDRETDVGNKRVDLLDYVRKQRRELVIKPNQGAGGEKVLIGRSVSQSRWEKRIESASKEKGKWVVQSYLDVSPRPMAYLKGGQLCFGHCYFSLGLFYYFDRLGLHCRISPSRIVNVARGGALAPVFVLRN